MSKVVITTEEVAKVGDLPQGEGVLPAPLPPVIPWWLKGLLFPLAFCLPAACLAALAARVLTLRSAARTRAAWQGYFLTVLIASGLLTSAAVVALAWIPAQRLGLKQAEAGLGLKSLEARRAFPTLPAEKELSAQELAGRMEGLVFVVSPGLPSVWRSRLMLGSGYGAGMLVAAEEGGYLIGTASHVVDGEHWKNAGRRNQPVTVRSAEGESEAGQVVARHRELDMALIWVSRKTNATRFVQPTRESAKVAIGETVYVFGHPEGFFFSFASGLVSGRREGRQIQFSAPISPGNSGGPLYDAKGHLLGVVSWTLDKTRQPNAENLNFAVPAEDLSRPERWQLTAAGEAIQPALLRPGK